MADASIIVKIVDQTRGGIGSVTGNVNKLGTSASNASTSFGGLQRAIGAVAAALSVRAFIDFGDSIQNVQNRIALINPELGTAAENFANIAQIANATFQPLNEVAGLYQKVAQSAANYNLTQDDVVEVTQTFTNLLRLAGADAGAAAGAITQFAQALGSGVLRGDEFNSIVEATAGEILPVLAAELGVSAGQVRALAQDGQITGEILVNALGAAADDVGGRVNKMGVTIGGSITYLQNKFLELGTESTPVFDAVAKGIMLIADNLDIVVTAAGVFFAAFAVKKIADITIAIGTLAKGITALNLTMLTNPVALAIGAISAAVLLAVTHWEDFREAAVNAFGKIEVAGLTLQKWFYQFLDLIVNDVVGGFIDMGRRVGNVLSAIAAAAKDPLNAMEVFREELERGEEQIKNNETVVIDFSGKIEDLEGRIAEASRTTDKNTDALDDNEGQTNRTADAKDDLTDSTEDNTDATDDNSDALDDNAQAARIAAREAEELRKAIENGTRAVNESIQAYENETYAMGIDEKQRTVLQRVIQEEQRYREALGDKMAELSEEQIRQILEISDLEELYTNDLINLTDEQIRAIISATEARQRATEERKAAMEEEREAARALSDFTRDTERLNQSYYEATTSKVQQLEDQKNEYIARARQQNRLNNEEVQSAIAEYERRINDQRRRDHEDLMRDYESDLRDFRSEYSAIYDDIYGVLEDWTGKSRSELDRYNQYAKLLFGVDLLGSFNGFVDNSLMSLAGWNTNATAQMQGFGNNTNAIMGQTGQYIGQGIFGNNGIATQGIGGFVGYALQAFGINGGGLLGAVTALFGGLGLNLQGIFSNVFGWISNGLSGVGGFLSNIFGGIVDFGSGLFGGIGNFFSGIVSGIGNFFSGLFADGGYIKPGTFGIVGEAGPEFVAGPATVTSARDTAAMMGGGNVNVNFSIQALDARGIDTLLIERKPLIADIVRDAVASSGRRI